MKQAKNMPRGVAQRIMKRYAAGERVLVLVGKNGKPSRVFGYQQYIKRVALTKKVRPWERRRKRTPVPDPLGAMALGKVIGSLRREDIYE